MAYSLEKVEVDAHKKLENYLMIQIVICNFQKNLLDSTDVN